jgi:hypothetical protein
MNDNTRVVAAMHRPPRRPHPSLPARRERPRRRAAEQHDEIAPLRLIKLHSIPASQGRIAGYRMGEK